MSTSPVTVTGSGKPVNGFRFLLRRDQNQVTVGQDCKIVMGTNNCNVAAGAGRGCECLIQLRRGQLPYHIPAQINFLDDGVGSVCSSRVIEVYEKMPIWHQLGAVRKHTGRRIVSPKHIPS